MKSFEANTGEKLLGCQALLYIAIAQTYKWETLSSVLGRAMGQQPKNTERLK